MVGPSGSGGGSSRRKSLDAEVNLVPFIDLLSMCICFLLMTAVWTQIGALQVKQSSGTEAAPTKANQMELDVKFSSPSAVEVSFKKSGKVVKKAGIAGQSNADLIAKLDLGMKSWLSSFGGDGQNISAAMLTPKVGVSYGDLVSVMDVLRKHQIVNLGVVPAGGGG